MVTPPLLPQLDHVQSELIDLSEKLGDLPVTQRNQLAAELVKIRSCIDDLLTAGQRAVGQRGSIQSNRYGTRGLTGLCFDHMQEAAMVYEVVRDENGRTIDWIIRDTNQAALIGIGYSREALIGMNASALLDQERIGQVSRKLDQVLATGKPCHNEETYQDRHYLVSTFAIDENTVVRIAFDITERKAAEAAHRLAEAHFNKAFNATPTALVFSRPEDGKILLVNDSFVTLFGHSREEVLGKTSLELNMFADPRDREGITRQLRDKHSVRYMDVDVRTKCGTILHANLTSELLDIDGDVSLFTIIHNNTERKRAEQLKQAGTDITQIMHSTFDFDEIIQSTLSAGAKALECDTAAVSTRQNGKWYISSVFGFSETVLGTVMDESQELHAVLAIQTKKPVAISDAFNDPRANNAHLKKWKIRSVLVVPVLIGEEAIGVIFFNYQKSTFVFTESHTDFAIHLAASLSLALKNSQLYQNLKEEINERKRVEAALRDSETVLRRSEALLRESQERFRVALSAVPLLVYTCDRHLRYTWVYNLPSGFSSEEVLGKRDDDLLPGQAAAELTAAKQRALDSGKGSIQEVKVPLDGVDTYFILTTEPIKGQQGEVLGLTCSAIDITDQKRLEIRQQEHAMQMEVQHRLIEQREKERQSIARDIHDGPVQTLASTLFNIQFAKEAFTDPQLSVEMEQIRLSVKTAVQELRQVIYELRPPSLIRFGLAQAIKFHAEDHREKNPELNLILHLADDRNRLSEMMCLTLYRIYQEAIINVLRHSEASKAWVNFHLSQKTLILEIRDNGKGLPAGLTVGNLTEHGHFGLAGIKERAEAINGELKITSNPGKGTSIRVKARLPQVD